MKNKSLFFILGSNSFTGSHFVKYLIKKKHKVICTSRSKEPKQHFLAYEKNNAYSTFYQLDINKNLKKIINLIKKKKPNYIINFASQSMVGQSWNYPIDWYNTNIISSVKLIEGIKKIGFIKKFVHISTPEVYGNTKYNLIENFDFNPTTPYAISRACFDNHLLSMFKYFNFPVVFTRASNVYGPCQKLYRIIPASIISASSNIKLKLDGGGNSKRNFIYVDDVVNATYKIALKGKKGESYHISSKEIISIKNLVKKVFKISKSKKYNKNVHNTSERVGKDRIYFLNSNKLRKELKWRSKVNLDDGIKKTLIWFNQNKKKIIKSKKLYIHKK